ncbi:MAG: tetratricopeptide repeat protein [Chloroflexota bacterium]
MASTAQKLHQAGVKLFQAADYQAALHKLQEALQHETDERHLAEIYNDIGVTFKELEDFPAAFTALDEAMSRFIRLNDQKGQAQTLGNRASIYQAQGELETAVETYKQSAEMFEALGESEMAMYVWQAISRLRMKQGQYIAAIGAYEEGVENMPKKSLKRKIMQQILKMPGSMLGGGGQDRGSEQEDD